MFAWTMRMPVPRSSDSAAAHASGVGGAGGASAADARLAALTASLAERLRAVCRDWEAAEFDALVDRIARTKLRWTDRGLGD